MLASILPGIREVRTPLAAGYIWLAFAFLVAGSPTEVSEVSGALGDLAEAAKSLGTAALAVAVSFIAYLVGSLSADIFRFLPRGFVAIVDRFGSGPYGQELLMRFRDLNDNVAGYLQGEDVHKAEATGTYPETTGNVVADIDGFRFSLDELQAAGRSESEQPEARRPMLEAEEQLRLAIVPPLAAPSIALSFDSIWWLFGLPFAIALYMQAAARAVEAKTLQLARMRASAVEGIRRVLRELAEALSGGEFDRARQIQRGIDWSELQLSLRPERTLHPMD